MRGAVAPLLINQASLNPNFENHPGLKKYGIESYIAVPLYRLSGEYFGTLCALDPLPSNLSKADFEMFSLFANLIAYELEAAEQRAELEEALKSATQSSERRARFMSILGHDLRSPLNTIRTAAILQKKGVLDPEKNAEMSDKIIKTADRMKFLIEDLLDMTQAVQGNEIYIERKHTDLSRICLQVIEEFKIAHSNRIMEFYSTGNILGQWDEGRFAQVLANLLSNALYYGSADAPVEVTLLGDGDRVILQVNNQGDPIPQEMQQNLFTPFWRGARKNAGNMNSSGLGLGLYIVKQIVKAHGGEINVESNKADGTTFTVALDRRQAESQTAA